MKVILISDVAKIGKRGSVAEVPDGYARNKLIPSGLAEAATKASLKRLEAQTANQQAEAAVASTQFAESLSKLKEQTLSVPVELNEQGHAFKAVSPEDIAAVATEAGVNVVADQIVISEPIKEAGEHTISLQSGADSGEFVIEVVKK